MQVTPQNKGNWKERWVLIIYVCLENNLCRGGGLKICPQILWYFSLWKAEPNSPRLDFWLDLAIHFSWIKYGRNDGAWIPRLGHKKHCDFLPFPRLYCSGQPSCCAAGSPLLEPPCRKAKSWDLLMKANTNASGMWAGHPGRTYQHQPSLQITVTMASILTVTSQDILK